MAAVIGLLLEATLQLTADHRPLVTLVLPTGLLLLLLVAFQERRDPSAP